MANGVLDNEICPLCGATTLVMYGCGWDEDGSLTIVEVAKDSE